MGIFDSLFLLKLTNQETETSNITPAVDLFIGYIASPSNSILIRKI